MASLLPIGNFYKNSQLLLNCLNKYVVTVERIVFEYFWCLGQFEGILKECFTEIKKKIMKIKQRVQKLETKNLQRWPSRREKTHTLKHIHSVSMRKLIYFFMNKNKFK
jgi:hypothetical protein